MCAEHGGEIRAFSKLHVRFRDLSDWNDFFERETPNVRAAIKSTAVTVTVAGVAGASSVAVAPALATRLGAMGLLGAATKGASIQSLSGAALTKASLAYLGGGALAAGGGGMALGTGVIGVAGAVLGAARGAQIANAYFGDVNGYEIEQVRSGDRRRRSLVFVNGFLQQKDGQFDDWERTTRKVFPGSSAYGVKWESGRLAKLGRDLAQVGVAAALPHGTGGTKKVPGHPALAAVVGVAKLLDNPWHVAWRKAAQVGVLNADMLARFRGPQCTLMGHSLGARAIYFTLLQLAEKGKPVRVKDVFLFGGAVGRAADWDKAASAVSGTIWNFYSEKDQVLSKAYALGTFFSSKPVGSGPIQGEVPGVVNVDCSHIVGGHHDFKEKLDELLGLLGNDWVRRRPV